MPKQLPSQPKKPIKYPLTRHTIICRKLEKKRVRVADVILGIRPDAAQLQGYDLKGRLIDALKHWGNL